MSYSIDHLYFKIIFKKIKKTDRKISIVRYVAYNRNKFRLCLSDYMGFLYIMSLYGKNLKYLSKFIKICYKTTIIIYEIINASSELINIRLKQIINKNQITFNYNSKNNVGNIIPSYFKELYKIRDKIYIQQINLNEKDPFNNIPIIIRDYFTGNITKVTIIKSQLKYI